MRLALLSDIHGNCYALKAVLDKLKLRNIDTLIITGDFVGYYFWPVEVFKLLESWDVVAIRGNHDRMLERAAIDKSYRLKVRKKYGSGLNIALEQLHNKTIKWLTNLPDSLKYETENGNVFLCHGSPWDRDEYVYPNSDNESLKRYVNLNVRWVVQGHTHYPMYKKIGDIEVINPGSVGQPRNGSPGAQWALLDTTSGEVKHFCEQYDASKVIREAKEINPEIPYLANILQRV
jgi:putative phosphoesterase